VPSPVTVIDLQGHFKAFLVSDGKSSQRMTLPMILSDF